MSPRPRRPVVPPGFALVSLALLAGAAHAASWPALPAGLLADSVAQVQPHADAEAVSWDIRIEHAFQGERVSAFEQNQIRIKVLTRAGADAQNRFDIEHDKADVVGDIDARVVEPDGRIATLDTRTIHERTLLREGGKSVLLTSFVVPDVQPGCVIDARWSRRSQSGIGSAASALWLQRTIPVRHLVLHIRSGSTTGSGLTMRSAVYQIALPTPQPDPDGTYRLDFGAVPAAFDETWAPPERAARAWMMLFYDVDVTGDVVRYWKVRREWLTHEFEPRIGSPNAWRDQLPAILGTAGTPEEKLAAIHRWCRRELRDLDDPSTTFTPAERSRYDHNRTARDTWERGGGTAEDVTLVFVALARAAGLDARVAMSPRRDLESFRVADCNAVPLQEYLAAVKVDDGWRFYDPGSHVLPAALPPWQCEGQAALVTDEDSTRFVRVPSETGQHSRVVRTGKFRLDAEGTLEGDVRIEHTGHEAVRVRSPWLGKDATECAKGVETWAHDRFPGSTVTEIHLEGVDDPEKSVVWSCHLRVPHYAEVTGKRLFVRPLVFESGDDPMFRESTRHTPIDLHFRRGAFDRVTIEYPTGYTAEDPVPPEPLRLEDFGSLDIHLDVDAANRVLAAQRAYMMERTQFATEDYAALKKAFDQLHASDGVTVVLTAASPAVK